VIGQVFDAAGNKLGGEFLVNSDPVGGERFGVVVPLLDGGFLVTWNEFPSTGDNYFGGITRAQRFNASGEKVGGEFALDEGFSSGQFYTAAAALPWGGVVIAHAKSGATTPGATLNIEARLLSPGAFVAADDELRVTESAGWSGNLFHDNGGGADSAPQGGKLVVSAVNGQSDSVGKTVTLPSGALLKLNADGTFDYDPNHAFDSLAAHDSGGSNGVGHDSFTYAIGGGGTATVDVTVFGEYSGPHIVLGTSGADNLTGSGLADTLVGGPGDDVYAVNHSGDAVQESAGEGTDEVRTALAAYVLAANVENLAATSDSPHDFRGNGGDNVVTGGGGADFLRLQDGGNDTASGGAGNDVFLFGSTLDGLDQVDGGSGTDQIAIQGDYSGAKALTLGSNLVSVENIAVLPGNDTRFGDPGSSFYGYEIVVQNIAVSAGAQLVIDASRLRTGEDFKFDGSAETDGSFFIYGGGGVDLLTGGSKNDVFIFGGQNQWGSGDVVSGGAGIDQLALRGNYTIVFGAGQLTGIEQIGMVSAQDTRYGPLGSSYSYDLTLVDANVDSIQMTVDASPLKAGETLKFNGSAEDDGSFRVFGGRDNDTIVGSRNGDFIQGNGGADALTGGEGADVFRYLSASDSTGSAVDHIFDFAAGTDRVDLSRIDADTLTAGDQAFAWIGSTAFSGAAGELRAYQDGESWFVEGDTDGDGSADFVLMLTLDGPTPLTAGDLAL
jgi:Ca2+-binding RTX toxin-like protein